MNLHHFVVRASTSTKGSICASASAFRTAPSTFLSNAQARGGTLHLAAHAYEAQYPQLPTDVLVERTTRRRSGGKLRDFRLVRHRVINLVL